MYRDGHDVWKEVTVIGKEVVVNVVWKEPAAGGPWRGK
jgi:hypothetical protein